MKSLKSGQIVIIDDSRGPIAYYMKALEIEGFETRHITSTKEALEHIDKNEPPADLYILDIMIPVGDSGLDEKLIQYGLTTGLYLRTKLRIKYPDKNIILLTNISAPEILRDLPRDLRTSVLSKPETLPLELAQVVKELLSQ